MQIGTVVDLCIDYNDRMKQAEREEKKTERRRGTQADIDAFLG